MPLRYIQTEFKGSVFLKNICHLYLIFFIGDTRLYIINEILVLSQALFFFINPKKGCFLYYYSLRKYILDEEIKKD